MPDIIDIERRRGDTKRIGYTILQDSIATDVSSGYSFLLTVDPEKYPVDATNNLFQLTGMIIDGPNGVIAFPITATQADNLGTYYYDIQMIDPNSEKLTICIGKIKFKQDITKD